MSSKLFMAGVCLAMILACGKESPENQKAEASVITGDCIAYSESSASLSGFVKTDGTDTQVSECGIEYAETQLKLQSAPIVVKAEGIGTEGSFNVTVDGLLCGTRYQYRAYAKTSDGIKKGGIKSFYTKDAAVSVSSTAVVSITEKAAEATATIEIKDKSQNVAKCGFLLSDTQAGIETSQREIIAPAPDENGVFKCTIDGLDYDRKYWICAFVEYGTYRRLGSVVEFATLPLMELKDAETSNIKRPVLSVEFTFRDRVTSPKIDFYYSPTEADAEKIVGNGTKVSATLNGNIASVTASEGVYCDLNYHFTAKITIGSSDQLLEPREFSCPTPDGTIDLGLSVLWATCNLGASKPEDAGDYYAWGATETRYSSISGNKVIIKEGHKTDAFEDYEYCIITPGESGQPADTTWTKYNEKDGKKQLDPEDDAATQILGNGWRTPTHNEWEELRNHTRCEEKKDGETVIGYYVYSTVSGLEDRYIYIPYPKFLTDENINNTNIGNAGLWSSTLLGRNQSTHPGRSNAYREMPCNVFQVSTGSRGWTSGQLPYGRNIRPVKNI